jgi:hypothetical protein
LPSLAGVRVLNTVHLPAYSLFGSEPLVAGLRPDPDATCDLPDQTSLQCLEDGEGAQELGVKLVGGARYDLGVAEDFGRHLFNGGPHG